MQTTILLSWPLLYKKWTTAAPRPRSAPTAAVCLGAAPVFWGMVEDAVIAPAAPPPIVLEGVGTPDANGLSDTEEAPG